MKSQTTLTVAMLVGAAVSIVNLLSGWLAHPMWQAAVVVLSLFAASLALLGLAIIAAWRERRQVMATFPGGAELMRRGLRGVRWSVVAASVFAVFMFANCSSSVTSGTSDALLSGPMSQPGAYFELAAALLAPLLLALALPLALITAAVSQAGRDLVLAHRLGVASNVSLGLLAAVAVLTAYPGAVVFGISACFFGTSPGLCGAGAGGVFNVLSVASIVLIYPYLDLVNGSLRFARQHQSNLGHDGVGPPVDVGGGESQQVDAGLE